MGLIPQDILAQVIERSDIVEIISHYTALKKAGRNFKALCPFHHEKTPSFVVNPDKQIFHCFGCGVGGNVLGFLMRQERLEFPDAVRSLAQKAGVVIPEAETPLSPSRQHYEAIVKVNAQAAAFFHEVLKTSREADVKVARDYLKSRGVDLDVVKKFQLGFAPNEWDALLKYLKAQGIKETLMQQAGLIIARENQSGYYDRFRNRIMFPILDIQNQPLGFGGRAIKDGDGAKYINSPETTVYAKARHLYGLGLSKASTAKKDCLIVVEGYMDMITPYVHGIDNIAASLGTALTVDQIRLIRRYTQNVLMLFDADAAGQAAIARSLATLIAEGMHVRVVTLGQDKDPDSFIRTFGVEAFKERLDGAESFFDFRLNWYQGQYDLNTSEGKAEFFHKMKETIALATDPIVRSDWARILKEKFKISERLILDELNRFIKEERTLSDIPMPLVAPEARKAEELLLALFLRDAAWLVAAEEKNIGPGNFSDGLIRRVVDVIWTLKSGEWSVNDLLTRLDDEVARSLVARLVNYEEGQLSNTQKVFEDCIGSMVKKKQKESRQLLMQAIRQAEAQGNTEKLDQLKEQFNQLLKT